jgi:hypothetical protein
VYTPDSLLEGNSRVHTFLGNSDGGFTPVAHAQAGVLNGVGVIAGDFDRNGRMDLVVAGRDPRPGAAPVPFGVVSALAGNGEGGLLPYRQFRLPAPAVTFAVGDLNNDHRLDVVTGGTGGVSALLNNSQHDTADGAVDIDMDVVDQLTREPSIS